MNTLAFTLGEHRAQLTLKISTYPNGNLAIKLYEKDHGILIFWETLTTNLTGFRPDHCAFINIKAADGLFPVWLSDNHLAEPTGQILESNGRLYPEYLFYGKELDALDHEGHTLYIRHQKGELGRRFERLYLALRRLAREINGFSYTDYSGWRCPDGVSATLPLWIEASDPSHGRKFIFTQKGPALQTTIRYADGTKKQRIYRRKEDMAAELMTMFQEELRVYPPGLKTGGIGTNIKGSKIGGHHHEDPYLSPIPVGNRMAAGQTAVYPRGSATTLVSSVWSAAGPQAGHQRPEPLCRCPYLRGVRYG